MTGYQEHLAWYLFISSGQKVISVIKTETQNLILSCNSSCSQRGRGWHSPGTWCLCAWYKQGWERMATHCSGFSHCWSCRGLSFPLQSSRKLVAESQHHCYELLQVHVTAYYCLSKQSEQGKSQGHAALSGSCSGGSGYFLRQPWSPSLGLYPHSLMSQINTLSSQLENKTRLIRELINKPKNSRLPFNYRRVIAMLIIISIKVKSCHHSGMNIQKIDQLEFPCYF